MKAVTITPKRDHTKVFGMGLLITAIIMSWALLNPLHAQTKIGIRGGLNISEPGLDTELGNTADLTKAYTGLDLAFVSEFQLANRLSLQAELGYTERGIRIGTGTDLDFLGMNIPLGITTTTKVRLLELPILAKYRLSEVAIKTYATVGPTIGYALSGNFKTSGTFLVGGDIVNENLDLGNQNRWSVGAIGGLGIELDKGPGTLFLEARYQYQSLKINNLPIDNVRFNNNGVGFNLGYKITI